MLEYLTTALSLYQSDSVLTVGQVEVFPTALQCNSNTSVLAAFNVSSAACRAPQLLPKGVAATWPPKK